MSRSDMTKIEASLRESCGTGSARALRAAGLVPAVVYGKGRSPISISLSQNGFLKQCRTIPIFSKLIALSIGNETEFVLTKDIQRHPVSGEILHVDFQFVDRSADIKVEVPLVFLNDTKCAGVKRGGTLNILLHTLPVLCSPYNMPSSIEVDVLDLSVGHSLHASDLKLPSHLRVAAKEENPVIVAVSAPDAAPEDQAAGTAEDAAEASGKES